MIEALSNVNECNGNTREGKEKYYMCICEEKKRGSDAIKTTGHEMRNDQDVVL